MDKITITRFMNLFREVAQPKNFKASKTLSKWVEF